MSRRALVIGAVLCCLGLPALAVLVDIASHTLATPAKRTIVSSGKERYYLLYVPKSYDAKKPTALVMSLHGAENWPSFQMRISDWNRVADKHGFLVVYPAGEGGGPRIWGMRGAMRTGARMPDVDFISDLIDRLQTSYNIDPARIYANGLSNGGGMSFALSCRLSHRIAAIGAVAAAETLPWEWCTDPTPVPMIAFHGTGDRITPYHGDTVWISRDPFPSIPLWTAKWARRNQCAATPTESVIASDVTRLDYRGCAANASVVLYTIKGGGHTWPGGPELAEWLLGPTTQSIDASEVMWAFFQEHPKR